MIVSCRCIGFARCDSCGSAAVVRMPETKRNAMMSLSARGWTFVAGHATCPSCSAIGGCPQ